MQDVIDVRHSLGLCAPLVSNNEAFAVRIHDVGPEARRRAPACVMDCPTRVSSWLNCSRVAGVMVTWRRSAMARILLHPLLCRKPDRLLAHIDERA